MADKALISRLTWRSLEMQKQAFPDMPHFIAPDELPTLLRPTRRKETLAIHVLSLAVIADTCAKFTEFWNSLPKDAVIISREDRLMLPKTCSFQKSKALWMAARRNGSAKIGAAISAKNKRDRSAAGIAKIKDRWPQGSGAWPTKVLLKEAGLSLNTVKGVLGSRPIAQRNYDAAQLRKAHINAKK